MKKIHFLLRWKMGFSYDPEADDVDVIYIGSNEISGVQFDLEELERTAIDIITGLKRWGTGIADISGSVSDVLLKLLPELGD